MSAAAPPVQWLRREARRIRRPLRRAAALAGALALALVAQAWLLSGLIDEAVFAHAPLDRLWPLWLGLLLLAVLRFGLSVAARRAMLGAAQRLTRDLRSRVLHGAQAPGPHRLRAQASGGLITRLVDGIDAVLAYFARYLPQLGNAVLVPPLLAACIFPADWLSGLILLLTAPLIPLFMALAGHAAGRASERRYGQLTRLGATFIEGLGGLVTLRQLAAADRFAGRLRSESEEYRALTMRVLRVAFLSALVLEFFAMVSIAMVAVLIGFRLLWGELHLRAGLFVLLLAPELYSPLRALGGLRHIRMDALAAAKDLSALDDIVSSRDGPLTAGAQAPPCRSPEIRIEQVSFAHGERAAALRGCTLTLKPNRVTALVGDTGAGKSTLLELLLGFALPGGGRILVDGVDLTAIEPAQWRARVAWVPQRTHVFEGSVRENVLLAAADADAGALRRAGERSGLAAVLERLPRGWDTPLGEHGLGLSGGQLQRLALARALLRERALIWLLDEPTAHLDERSARAVEAVIRAAAATRTVVLVAHRLQAANRADWVAVLSGGRIIEQGAPIELRRSGGAYAQLLQAERS